MAGRRRPAGSRRKKKNNTRRMLVCVLAEFLVLLILAAAMSWQRGLGAWVENLSGLFDRPVVKELSLTGLKSTNALLMDGRSGKVIGSLEGEAAIYPASMTKIMTAVTAIEELSSLEREITLSQEMFDGLYEQGATQAGFQPGETVRALDLLYGAMLPSGAECCIALAEDISGSEAAFVEKMNKKAKRLGMKKTNFCNTTGLHDPDHYSSAYDMALLLRYALHNTTFREIAGSQWHSTPATNVHPDGITYYNTMFKNMSTTHVNGGEILGGKTGYTGEAGHCLASYAQIQGREYILVTAGAPADATGIPHIQDAYTVYNRLGTAAQK
ncbi:MAG: serine hydrolase [Eubacteriales bacterium]|nr:serine hydrolase [Eubacteriales bacterium]